MKNIAKYVCAVLCVGLSILPGWSNIESRAAGEQRQHSAGIGSSQKLGMEVYDPTADFEAGWVTGQNPNGVWRYGWTHGLSGPLTLYTRHYIPIEFPEAAQLHVWDDPNNWLFGMRSDSHSDIPSSILYACPLP